LADSVEKVWKENEPKYGGNMGYRRGYAMLGACHVRQWTSPGDYRFAIPVTVIAKQSELDRLSAHLFENTGKQAGCSILRPLDYLKAAIQVVAAGGQEATLVKANVKRGTAQKVFALASLNARFPTLKLADRLFADEPVMRKGQHKHAYKAGCFIPFGCLETAKLRHMAKGVKGTPNTEEVPRAETSKEVEEYVSKAMRGVQYSPRCMGKKAMEAKETHAVELVRIIVGAVLANKETVFETLAGHANVLNEALKTIRETSKNL